MRTRSEPASALLDRQRERAVLDGLLEDLRSARGRALVVRGEAGVGKSALLEYAAAAAGMRIARAAGVESEMELAFASLAPATCTKSPAPPAQPRRPRARPGRPICCWTGWPCWSPRDAPRQHPG